MSRGLRSAGTALQFGEAKPASNAARVRTPQLSCHKAREFSIDNYVSRRNDESR